ncbi:MAG: PqqD family protein [candidate division NC10 bacterium]|nr:PqqD family protein [candidate division NC10 bacterium]
MVGLSDSATYRQAEDFVSRNIAGETVLVPLRRQIGDLDSIYTLNEVATFIWECLAQPSTVGQLTQALGEAFDAPPATIRQDLEEHLGQLLAIGAIRPAA